MIANLTSFLDYLTSSPCQYQRNLYGGECREFGYWYWGVQGVKAKSVDTTIAVLCAGTTLVARESRTSCSNKKLNFQC